MFCQWLAAGVRGPGAPPAVGRTHLELCQGVGVVAQAKGVEEAACSGREGQGRSRRCGQPSARMAARAAGPAPGEQCPLLSRCPRPCPAVAPRSPARSAFAFSSTLHPPTWVQRIAGGINGAFARHAIRLGSACAQQQGHGQGEACGGWRVPEGLPVQCSNGEGHAARASSPPTRAHRSAPAAPAGLRRWTGHEQDWGCPDSSGHPR